MKPAVRQLLMGGSRSQLRKLTRFNAQLAAAGQSLVNIGWFGNSITAGAYSDDVGATDDLIWNTTGQVAIFRALLGARFGAATTKGLIHPAENGDDNFTLGGGNAIDGPYNSVGLAGYRVNFTAATHTASISVTGRYLRVWAFCVASGIEARYTLDGGALTGVGTTSSGASPNGQVWYSFDIDMGTNDAHTVVLQGAAAGAWYLYAYCAYSSLTAGVAVHRLGVSGKVLPEILASSLDATDSAGPSWLAGLTANGKEQQLQSLTTRLGLHLAIIHVDANDLTGGWTTYAYTLTDIRRHAQNIATALTAKGIDVVFFTTPYRRTTDYAVGVPFNQGDVIAQYADVAAKTANVAHFSLAKQYGTFAAMNASGLMYDGVHPKSTGHAFLGTEAFKRLTQF